MQYLVGCRVGPSVCDVGPICALNDSSVSASWVDGLWLISDESRTECVNTWSSYDNGRRLVPGYYGAW